ncbi:serine--tRNA ligase [archaeon]|nr:serine--tRNA ligase [archaeon]MBT4417517.1 serine--tRNA ligase [archaeon]
MFDIKIIRNDIEIAKKDLEKRGDKEKLDWLQNVSDKDVEFRKLKVELDGLRKERNKISLSIAEAKKKGDDVKKILADAKELPKKIADIELRVGKLQDDTKFYLMRLPNILHESVPKGKDDTENVEIKTVGKIPKFTFDIKNHVDIVEGLGLADFDRSGKIAGNGFYFLKGDLVFLEQALIRFALDIVSKKGYLPVYPPLMMRRKAYEGVTDLSDFETMMYKIEDDDEYLIATSEHPLVGQHMDEIFESGVLPVKYAGISPCFRKEIGSHGVDEKGIFRVHQFNKVEQIIFCKPADSWKLHEELIKNAEEIFKKLALPYRVVNICTGDIGTVAAKKYDLEAWLPHQKRYREMVSCSNCTDYQARRLRIRYNSKDGVKLVHTLNSTAIALGRVMVAIIENNQLKDGSVKIPKVLVPYMGGKTKLEKI